MANGKKLKKIYDSQWSPHQIRQLYGEFIAYRRHFTATSRRLAKVKKYAVFQWSRHQIRKSVKAAA